MSVNDGAQAVAAFGVINNAVPTSGTTTFYGGVLTMPQGSPLLFMQGGRDYAQLAGGAWMFGPGSLTSSLKNATLNVVDSPRIVSSTEQSSVFGTVQYYAQTAALALNSNIEPASIFAQSYLPTRIAFLSGGAPTFNIDANNGTFAVRDATNNIDVLNYSTTAKVTTYPNAVKANYFVASNGSTTSYAYNPGVQHTDTIPGICGTVITGSVTQIAGLGATLGAVAVNNAVTIVVPIRCMKGQIVASASAKFSLNAAQNGQSVSVYASFARYDTPANAEALLSENRASIPVSQTTFTLNTGPLNNETSNDGQCWYMYFSFSSTQSFNVFLRYINVTLTSTSLNPQRQ